MAIEIRETFQVRAPVDTVWQFVMDPQRVVTCMPGATLQEVVDDHTFLGSVKVKVGAITTSYTGRVQFTKIDAQAHVVQVLAEGRETGGGQAKGTMSSQLRALPDGQTEVVAEATVDLTGRIMQVGRGMIQGVAQQLFKQFAAALKQRLEAPAGDTSEGLTATGEGTTQTSGASAPTPAPEAIHILPIIFQVVWAAAVRFFRRIFGFRA